MDSSFFAVVVVTYFPDEMAIQNLYNCAKICDLLVIVDNTDEGPPFYFRKPSSAIFIHNNKNIGLAAALNAGIELSASKGYENIFLIDQDSIIPDNYFKKMLSFINNSAEKTNSFICVPNFYDRNSKTFAGFMILSRIKLQRSICPRIKPRLKKEAFIAITSGTYIKYSQYKRIGPFREDYFIDCIDHEYCLRTASAGFEIKVNCEAVISHSIGKRSAYKVLGLTIKPNNHPPFRKYYFFRNSLRTAVDYFKAYPSYSFLAFAHMLHEFLAVLFFESDKIVKIKSMAYGIAHGLFNKMGRSPCRFF